MNEISASFVLSLDRLIDKYYRRLSVRGLLMFLFFFILSALLFSVTEVLFHLSSSVRFVIFIAFLSIQVASFSYFFVLNVLRLFNFLPRISYLDACKIIQVYHSELKDIPINILQLSNQEKSNLVDASIKQKLKLIDSVDFSDSVNINVRKPLLFLSAISVLSLLLHFTTNIFSCGASNIIHFSKETIANSDFTVLIDNKVYNVEQGSDLQFDAIVLGDKLPSELFVSVMDNKFIMNRQADTLFSYVFRNVNNSFEFFIVNNSYKSSKITVNVYQSPIINSYKTEIYYPKHVNKQDTIVNNQNILIVPQGTFLKTSFYGSNFDSLQVLSLPDSSSTFISKSNPTVFSKKIFRSANYKFILHNPNVVREFVNFKVVSVPDLYPELSVSIDNESSSSTNTVFTGVIKDDYGFTKLALLSTVDNFTDTVSLPIYPNITTQKIFYNYQNDVNSDIDDKLISFCFELYDNDAVNGPKKVKVELGQHIIKSISNQTIEKEAKYNDLFQQLEFSKQLSDEIKFDIDELRKKLLNDNLSEWEKNFLLKQISDKSSQLEKLLNSISQSQNQIQKTYSDSQRILEKQNLISEMLNSLLDDEMKKIMQEISDLARNNAQQYNSLSNDLKKDFEGFEKSIDKDLELLKKIKVEESIQQLADNLSLLSEKQKDLRSQPLSDSLSKSIDSQQKFFNDLVENYKKTINDNQLLERPYDISNFNNEFDDINSEFENEKNNSDNGNRQDFDNSIKKNADRLDKLSSELSKMIDENNRQEQMEDADDLRQILDNLFEISFFQEDIITSNEGSRSKGNLSQSLILRQSQLIDNFKIVQDSLYALSRRSVMLGTHISSTAFIIEDEMMKAVTHMQNNSSYKSIQSQRSALKNVNDLILLLSESLKNVESGSGAGQKSSIKNKKQKPGKQDNSMSDMRKAQESIKNQMKDLLNKMKSGDSKSINAEMAKSLMQNEIYQQMLNQMMYNADIDSRTSKLLQEVRQLMEKNHNDLANKKLSVQTVLRQQNIVTKLLEAENAENEKDKDERRESTTAKNINRNSTENSEEETIFEKNIDFLQQNELKLNSFYKSKFEEYLNSINTETNE